MPCCDGESRRELVRRLAGRIQPRTPTMVAPRVGYVHFPPPSPRDVLQPVSEPRRTLRPPSFDTWELLLTWMVDIARAKAGFAVNSEGFVIATAGEDHAQSWDGLGADLCLAFDEMGKTAPQGSTLRSLCLQFDKHWLVGIRSTGQNAFTVGLMTAHFEPHLVESVSDALGSSLEFLA